MNESENVQVRSVNLALTVDEVNVVLAGLGELPAKASLAVIDKIRGQAIGQLQAAPAAEPAVPTVEAEVVN